MYRTVLVATDGSKRAHKALTAAVRMVRGTAARLIALHVRPTYISTVSMAPDAIMIIDKGEFDAHSRRAAERILGDAREYAFSQGVKCRTIAVSSAGVAKAIVQTAKSVRADVIVMASHGHGLIASLVLGSTTQKVLASCRIPVLVHR